MQTVAPLSHMDLAAASIGIRDTEDMTMTALLQALAERRLAESRAAAPVDPNGDDRVQRWAAVTLPWPTDSAPGAATAAWFAKQRSPHTKRAYMRDLGDYLAWLRDAGVDPVTASRADATAYCAALGARESSAAPAVRRRLAALNSWYRFLVDAGVVADNPIAGQARPLVSRGPQRYGWTERQLRELLRAAQAELDRRMAAGGALIQVALRNRAMLGVLAVRAVTVTELIGLRVADFQRDGQRYMLAVLGRTGRVRQLRLSTPLGNQIEQYLQDRLRIAASEFRRAGPRTVAADEPLFSTSTVPLAAQPRPLRQAYVYALVRRLASEAGLPNADRISPQAIRRATAAAAVASGIPVAALQDLLGHAQRRSTRRLVAG